MDYDNNNITMNDKITQLKLNGTSDADVCAEVLKLYGVHIDPDVLELYDDNVSIKVPVDVIEEQKKRKEEELPKKRRRRAKKAEEVVETESIPAKREAKPVEIKAKIEQVSAENTAPPPTENEINTISNRFEEVQSVALREAATGSATVAFDAINEMIDLVRRLKRRLGQLETDEVLTETPSKLWNDTARLYADCLEKVRKAKGEVDTRPDVKIAIVQQISGEVGRRVPAAVRAQLNLNIPNPEDLGHILDVHNIFGYTQVVKRQPPSEKPEEGPHLVKNDD